jgi:multicomponent Na+:H+ antiporter subunit E
VNDHDLATAGALAASLFAFWLVLSGMYTAFLVASGAGAAIAIAAFARRMEVVDREGYPLRFLVAIVTYWPWLAKEILVCGWRVARIVADPRLPVSPVLVRFRPSQESVVGLVTHANSITLTPGTLTVEAEPGEFLVHALTREGGAELEGSDMDRRVRRLEGGR